MPASKELIIDETQIYEILNPRITPELGFQSYEMLGGDGEYRQNQKENFLNGKIYNPDLDYPKLDLIKLSDGISKLEEVLSIADTLSEPQRSTVWDSIAYRMAEMYWLRALVDINKASQDGDKKRAAHLIPIAQAMGEELYGKPDEVLEEQIMGEFAAQLSTKKLDDTCLKILEELRAGFKTINGHFSIEVPPIEISETKRLPEISTNTLDKLRDKIIEQFPDIIELVENYYSDVVIGREEESRFFTPEDMLTIFQEVHRLRDPENISGVSVVFDKDATNLAWSTPLMSVIIGGRRKPISSVMEMVGKVVHEYGFHCGRAINGIRSGLAVLGTGVYSEAESGEQPDYLTFEEGSASLSEKALLGQDIKWAPLDIEKTLGLCLAYKGYDFRQTYETLWRIRVLLLAKEGKDTSEKMINTAKSNSYNSCVRIYRGTPTAEIASSKKPILTFNKDLAYLKGKLIAADFVESATDEDMELLFLAKIDPTNRLQKALAKQYFPDYFNSETDVS